MKLLIIFFAIALSALAEPSQEPSDLTLLRKSWMASKAAAIKPLDEKYAASLTAMRDKYTKAANLGAAIFVDNELKALKKEMDDAYHKDESKQHIQVRSPNTYSVHTIGVGVSRVNGYSAPFTWVSDDIKNFEFIRVQSSSWDAKTVIFLDDGEVYVTLMDTFNTRKDVTIQV